MGAVERLTVLFFLLAQVGCERAKLPEQPATTTRSPQGVNPAPKATPSQPVTPKSIVKDLFPNAPEKTQSVECFRSLTPGMSIYAVVQKCGRPDEEVGSGIAIFLYHMRDGSNVAISAAYLPKIDGVTYTNPSGKRSSFLNSK